MAVITKTIGTTGRDYSTVQAWEDALPANLVTDGNSQVGNVYNDGGAALSSGTISISGETTDSTQTITLQAAPGQGFKDNPSVQTAALKYDASVYAALSYTNIYGTLVNAETISWFFIKNLQLNANIGSTAIKPGIDGTIDSCLIQGSFSSPLVSGGNNSTIKNCVIIQKLTASGGCISVSNAGCRCYNNTFVRPSDLTAAGTCINLPAYAGTYYIRNNAVFGFSTFSNHNGAGTDGGSGNNCTDLSSADGSSNQVSKTFTNQFVGTTDAAQDWRAKAAADVLNNGADLSASGVAVDIVGTARPQGAAYDIGAWELVVAASTPRQLTTLGAG